MFRTSRTARRRHAARAWIGRWPPPARGLSRAAWIVVVAAAILAALSSPAVAASPTKGATYAKGIPSDDTEVELHVSGRGRGFADFSISVFMPCSNGRRALGYFLWLAGGPDQPARVPIKRDGSFSGTFVDRQHFDPFAVSGSTGSRRSFARARPPAWSYGLATSVRAARCVTREIAASSLGVR